MKVPQIPPNFHRSLAGPEAEGGGDRLHRNLEVHVVEDDHRRLPAQLEMHALERVGRGAGDRLAQRLEPLGGHLADDPDGEPRSREWLTLNHRLGQTELRADGTRSQVTGLAQAVPDGRNSRLRVKFEGLAALAPVSSEGNYWIIKLAPDYSAALVGTPDRKFLWMLSRTPTVSEARRSEYLQEARRQGFDISQVIHHRRTGSR